ncbi:MAG TPA: hypothetical protein VKM72_30415 [Thermoanaerobaculia bacterium]|nr:hypothetical protein [Thermoanaerobaculia bacterium]
MTLRVEGSLEAAEVEVNLHQEMIPDVTRDSRCAMSRYASLSRLVTPSEGAWTRARQLAVRRYPPGEPVLRGGAGAAWCMIESMQLATGIVVKGKVVVEGEPLPEGTVVTILAREADETFEVPPELEAELLASIAEADRGETISADELIERLRRIA